MTKSNFLCTACRAAMCPDCLSIADEYAELLKWYQQAAASHDAQIEKLQGRVDLAQRNAVIWKDTLSQAGEIETIMRQQLGELLRLLKREAATTIRGKLVVAVDAMEISLGVLEPHMYEIDGALNAVVSLKSALDVANSDTTELDSQGEDEDRIYVLEQERDMWRARALAAEAKAIPTILDTIAETDDR